MQGTGENAFGLHDGVTRLVDVVAAAQLHILSASVTSYANGDIAAAGRAGHAIELRRWQGQSAESEGEDSGDGELHFGGLLWELVGKVIKMLRKRVLRE